MYGKKERDLLYQQNLIKTIEEEYGIKVISFTPAQRGYYGETWRVASLNVSFFLKIVYASKQKEVYRRSLDVVDHLNLYSLDSTSQLVKTKKGDLCLDYDGAVLAVFTWLDGVNVQNRTTKIAEYTILSRVYCLPLEDLEITKEDFSTRESELFWKQYNLLKDDESADGILNILHSKIELIKQREKDLAILAQICQSDRSHFYLTHGDAGNNIIQNGECFYLIDWDNPCLAPPERDAWFCLHWDWAMTAFEQALWSEGIEYSLKKERLAYYAYQFFFFYLNEFLRSFFDMTSEAQSICLLLEEYFGGWIEEAIAFVENNYELISK